MINQDQAIQDLLRLWKFFEWLDNARWNWERKQGIKRLLNYTNEVWDKPIDDFEPDHLVLSHWLTYIFDYQMPFDKIWKGGFPIMAYIAKEFQQGCSTEKIIEKYKKQENGEKTVYFSICLNKNFKHRFMHKHELHKKVERTLKILEECFNKDLIELMTRISSYGEENDWIRKIACALYLLTYDTEKDEKEAINILTDEEEFKGYFSERNENLWYKRLWSALRDYLKSGIHQYILKALEKHDECTSEILNRWKNPQKYFNQLEVPGDTWNKEFYKLVVKPIVEPLVKKDKLKLSNDPPKAIRMLYRNYHGIFESHGFYPEQFDVTFDFARIFCGGDLCHICPLYKKNENIKRLCIGDSVSKNEKYCPILLMLGYLHPCRPDECPVYKNETANLCSDNVQKSR